MLTNVSNPFLGLRRLCATGQLLITLSIGGPLVIQLDARQLVFIRIVSLQLDVTITLKGDVPKSLHWFVTILVLVMYQLLRHRQVEWIGFCKNC
jgi:hypothetical protein